MSTELSNGVIIPEEYSDDWYDEMSINLRKLNDVITAASDNATDIQKLDTDKANSADLATVATSGSYNDLSNKPSIPTKTSDLTNDSNFVDTSNSAVASGITSAKVTSYDNHIIDTDIHVTTADKTKWNTVTSKANDSDVVHLSGNENVGGNKNFRELLTTQPNNSLWPEVSNTTDDITSLSRYAMHIEQRGSGKLTDLSGGAWNVVELGDGCFFFRLNNGTDIRYKHLPTNLVNRIYVVNGANRHINDLIPDQDNTRKIGSNSLRWATFNGINPGALSMPDLSKGVDISSYIIVNGGNKESLYTPPANGWISVSLTRTGGANMAVMLKQGSFASSGHNIALENGTTTCNAMLPVKGGVQVSINSALADGIDFAYFYPCLGNV